MGIRGFLSAKVIAKYGKSIREAQREVIFSRNLIISALIYATTAIPCTWDQGSASVMATLPGFQHHFGISSEAGQIRTFVSIVFIGQSVGALGSFFINDRIGRLWSLRLYIAIWSIGQLVGTFAPGLPGLYASRIITGLGIGSLTVTGPMSLAEIAPAEIRGLITSWFTVAMGCAQVSSTFCVYGIFQHVPASKLQYQIVFFSPCVFLFLCAGASFLPAVRESPRWLFLVGRHEEGVQNLVKLRNLPADHPRVQKELAEIRESIRMETTEYSDGKTGILGLVKEMFTVPSNLRRLQQTLVSYGLAQLSGANSVTSYFIPILTLLGVGGSTTHHLFLTGMYAFSKSIFIFIASFFLIDVIGRRKSLFLGASFQMLSDLYLGVFLNFRQWGHVPDAASQGAIAFIFIHAFGYMVGLFILPYVFGGELWPNRIRSFGGALSQGFHWIFIYAMQFGTPSLLKNTNNWGAFIFFASWCLIAILYVFLMVPEVAGLSVEEIDDLFRGPWYNAYKRSKRPEVITLGTTISKDVPSEEAETVLDSKV